MDGGRVSTWYRPEVSLFRSPDCWSCRYTEEFMTRGWDSILPGCGRISTLAKGTTLPARWLYEPQPFRDQAMGVGFPHHVGWYRLGGSPFSFLGCWSCRRCPEGQLTLLAGSMIHSQSAISRCEWDLHTVLGGIDPRDHCFRPRAVGVVFLCTEF